MTELNQNHGAPEFHYVVFKYSVFTAQQANKVQGRGQWTVPVGGNNTALKQSVCCKSVGDADTTYREDKHLTLGQENKVIGVRRTTADESFPSVQAASLTSSSRGK